LNVVVFVLEFVMVPAPAVRLRPKRVAAENVGDPEKATFPVMDPHRFRGLEDVPFPQRPPPESDPVSDEPSEIDDSPPPLLVATSAARAVSNQRMSSRLIVASDASARNAI